MLHQRYPSALIAHKRPIGETMLRLPKLPKLPPRKYRIDPVAFGVALIGAPLLVALPTFWMFLIPVFAIYFGGIPYLVLGTPALLYFLPRHGHDSEKIALLALGVMTVALIVSYLLIAMGPNPGNADALVGLGVFGLLFAPLWGAAFGWIYGRLARPDRIALPK